MIRDFYILGEICGSTDTRWCEEDLCPQSFKKFASSIEDGDELVLHINSPGGDVWAGFTIASIIKDLSDKGVKTTAVVEGLAASIASVIACACDTVKMYESSFMMIHNCWSVVQGNADALRKEAETMDKIDAAIRSFYHKHFDLTDAELEAAMDAETWISGSEVEDYKLNADIVNESRQFKIAACLDKMKFNKVPETVRNSIMEKIDKVEVVKTEAVESETTEAQTTEETTEPTETTVEEPKMEDEVQMLPMAEVEKRVSGMQSTMAKQMDAMRKEYDAKIDEFKNQLKAKEEELETAKAESISLSQKLDVANEELRKTASALEEKSNALATLNAGVLTPAETEESWRTLKGKEFLDYVNAHKKELSK